MTGRWLLVISGGAIAMAAPSMARARMPVPEPRDGASPADADDTDSEIMVTGQRRQYASQVPTLQVPQSIQLLSGDTLRAAGITQLATALDFASGIARQNNFGGLFDSFACRGFAGDENSASNYLVNGFNAARGFGGARDISNVDRIEIVKGPNSAIFGRGEPGCTVNIITRKPYFDTGGTATLSAGSFDTVRGEADLNLPLSSRIALRVTGAAERSDTFRDLHSRKYTVTPSILARLGEDTSLSYELEYIRQQVPFDRGIVALNGDLKTISKTVFLGEPGDGPVTVRALGHQAQLQHDFDPHWSVVLGVGYRDTAFKGFSSEPELAAGRQRFYLDGQTVSRQRRYRDYSTTDLTFRGEVSGRFDTVGIAHHLLFGADRDDYVLDVIQNRYRPPLIAAQSATSLASGNRIPIFAPVYGTLPAVSPFQKYRERQGSYGLYVQDQLDVTDALKIRIGGRYDDFEQAIDNRITLSGARQHKTAFSPSIGATYLLTDMVSIYANHGRGFRPNGGTDFNNRAFAPERTQSWEAGVKLALLHERLTGTLAVFRTDKTNMLSADPVNSGFSLAVGKARSRGVEFALSGRLPADFRLQLTYAHIDAEVAEDALDVNFGYALRSGDPLINIAKNSGSVLLFKDVELGGSTVTLGGGVNHVGKRLGETGFRFADGSLFMLPGYTLTRLMASFSPDDHLKLSGEVTNMFDEDYFPSSYSRLWLMPGAPRQFMLRAGYSF